MAIVVNVKSNDYIFENGTRWDLTDGPLKVYTETGILIAEFGMWDFVRSTPQTDQQLQFTEALELIGEVDQGNFSNQDNDWVERAETLLAANK